MRHGFSLVELSIVLVILGLLTGGILAGQSLIRASELRAVTSEFHNYTAAVQTFRDKYFALPGDMSNATAFWGVSTACAGTSATGTCNGNGDGHVDLGANTAGASGEIFQFWNQLALAGLIEGHYSGIAGTNWINMIGGTNVPKSHMSNAIWGLRENWGTVTGNCCVFDGTYGNVLQLGAPDPASDNDFVVLKPEELWNLDTKLDDGKPATGSIVSRLYPSCVDSTVSSNLSANYLLSSSAVGCVFEARNQFN